MENALRFTSKQSSLRVLSQLPVRPAKSARAWPESLPPTASQSSWPMLNSQRLERVAREIADARARVLPAPTDVTDPRAPEHPAQAAYAEFGNVSLLVNNVGIESTGWLWNLLVALWDRMLRVNNHAIFFGNRAFVPRMIAAGTPAHIAIVASAGTLLQGTQHWGPISRANTPLCR